MDTRVSDRSARQDSLDPGRVHWHPVTDTTAVLAAVGAGFACFRGLRALLRYRGERTRRAPGLPGRSRR